MKRHTIKEILKLSKYETTTDAAVARTEKHLAVIVEADNSTAHVVCSCGYVSNAPFGVVQAEEQRENHYARWGGARFLPSLQEITDVSRPLSRKEMKEREERNKG